MRLEKGGQTIGYIPRAENVEIAERPNAGEPLVVRIERDAAPRERVRVAVMESLR